MPSFETKILESVKKRLKEKKIPLSEVATALGLTSGPASRILNGKTRLTLQQLEKLTEYLRMPLSALVQEAEGGVVKSRPDKNLEHFICQDIRRYFVFLALETPTTLQQISKRLGFPMSIVTATALELEKQGVVERLAGGTLRLRDSVRSVLFGTTRRFYEMKAKLYATQALDTYKNLDRGAEYWANKDDTLFISQLTESQALMVAKQIENVIAMIKSFEQMNFSTADAEKGIEEGQHFHMVFITQKPISEAILRDLSVPRG